jgi:ribosomal protein L12E/L44/L45/RPP1/RPP2
MTELLNRDELIALLNRLGGDEDEEVLQAARQAHSQIAAAGVSWEDLLVPEEPDEESPEPEDQELEEEEDEEEEEEEEDGSPAEPAGTDADSLALIGKLLARSDISAELRAELEDYKADIAEGEFLAADRRYLRAVHERLSK